MESISWFIEERLKLKVNPKKSAVAPVQERKFLGYQITAKGPLRIAKESLNKMKARVAEITRRNRGAAVETVLYVSDRSEKPGLPCFN